MPCQEAVKADRRGWMANAAVLRHHIPVEGTPVEPHTRSSMMHHKHCEKFAVPSCCCETSPWLSQASNMSCKLHDKKLKIEQEDTTVAAGRLGASRQGSRLKRKGEGQTEKKSWRGERISVPSRMQEFKACHDIYGVLSKSHIMRHV